MVTAPTGGCSSRPIAESRARSNPGTRVGVSRAAPVHLNQAAEKRLRPARYERPAQADHVRPLDRNLHGVPDLCDAPREGYDVYPVVDAIGGTSEEAHRTGIERVVQAGAHPVTGVALAVELQRDWTREETVADVIEIVLTGRLLKE